MIIWHFRAFAWLLIALALPLSAAPPGPPAAQSDWIMYVGTFTRPPSKGIYAYRFQSTTGKLTPIGAVAQTENPSFLAIHPNHRFLYAVNEINQYEGQAAGSVSAYAINSVTGELKLLNRVSSRGTGPCHVSLDRTGKWLFTANYAGGSVAAFPVRDDDTLGEASSFFQHSGSSVNPRRQGGPHAHVAAVSPDNRRVLVADLGLDQILAYRLDPTKGGLVPNEVPFTKVAPGSGPRHVTFGPNGRFLYALNEISSTVTVFQYDAARGSLEERQTVKTLPDGFSGNNSTAEIEVHPGGKFLYVSNRGADSIAIFGVDPARSEERRVGKECRL